jgi:mannobiose 2-epimerase
MHPRPNDLRVFLRQAGVPFIICLSAQVIAMHTTSFAQPDSNQAVRLRSELRGVLDTEFRRWYPLAIDSTEGGFLSDLNVRWEREGPQNKMIVTQARHVWSASNGAMFYQTDNTLRDVAAHGVKFLTDVMWDSTYGGFYWLVDRAGVPIKEDGKIIKRAYGIAFAIYGLAAYHRASGDTASLRLAREAFLWLEKYSYDPDNGGYFQFMTREGTALPDGFKEPPKDQNSTIHLLEAFTELYCVWPDSLLKLRLGELLMLVRDRITTPQGYMRLFFERDWTPVSYRDSPAQVRQEKYDLDHISFCHDIEVAYLILEAAQALGIPDDPQTIAVAKTMTDHVLAYGWDQKRGGVFDGGYIFPGNAHPIVVRGTKEWWGQVEALNTLLLMHDLFPLDDHHYFGKFLTQWEYCKNSVIDTQRGGWFWGGTDGDPSMAQSPKSSIWKANYHTSRGLINCIHRLESHIAMAGLRSFPPVNPDASPEARELLERLYNIRGKRILAGHHNYVDRIDTYPDRIEELTGKRPEVWGCDFIGYYRPGYGKIIVDEAVRHWQEGYIITLMWHAGRPQDDPPFGWKESVQAKISDAEWDELLTPGSPLNDRWVKQVDAVAAFLRELNERHVPVLWRPYHEQNGVWFWWGNRKGERGSAALYRMLFDRLVDHHKLNNLIWVWNSNAPRQLNNDEAYAYSDFFPGREVVDVLAADVYHHDYRRSHHDELAELAGGKLIALGEIGDVPAPEVLDAQPLWTWFMIWGDFVDTHNTPEQIRALYNSPRVITHATGSR